MRRFGNPYLRLANNILLASGAEGRSGGAGGGTSVDPGFGTGNVNGGNRAGAEDRSGSPADSDGKGADGDKPDSGTVSGVGARARGENLNAGGIEGPLDRATGGSGI